MSSCVSLKITSLGGMKFGQLILRRIVKIVATKCQILRLKCTNQNRFRLGLRPRHRWGSLQRSPETP